ncbi:hypothetical protein [Rhizobium leguminosarum]|uniref:hypothetical protein n=1 Tax=Rhizobium leguminosarum TaxID=384 RepID=UPI0021BC129E|nr:hypothetical protein [Rhizobium leguminosarum]
MKLRLESFGELRLIDLTGQPVAHAAAMKSSWPSVSASRNHRRDIARRIARELAGQVRRHETMSTPSRAIRPLSQLPSRSAGCEVKRLSLPIFDVGTAALDLDLQQGRFRIRKSLPREEVRQAF